MDEDEDEEQDGPAASSVSEEELVLEQTEKQQIKDVAGAGETEKRIKQVVEQTDRVAERIKQVVERISKLLLQHRHRGRRVSSTDSVSLSWFHYLEAELSGISETLKQLPLPDLGPDDIDSSMSGWLRQLTDMAELIGTELDIHEQAGAITSTVRCYCTRTRTSLPWLHLYKIITVADLIESPCRYKHLLLVEDDEITSRTTSSLQLPPYMETDATRVMPLVGIESALGNKALRWFMDDHQQKGLKIISMVGPAGVGKTAIAMEVYRRLQTRSAGNSLCCATAIAKVSPTPHMKNLLLHILSQIDEPAALALPSIDELELELLIHKISQRLQDRRYLILIDDIWKISDWESMKNAFPPNSQGSRIVMTTRIRSVASRCCLYSSGLVHEVKSLGEVDSKMLLYRKAFGCEVNNAPENFSIVCAEILRRCEGIPLFIHGMADWLQEQHQRVQHMQLQKLFERALSPSYDDLTYKMKLLVLYMSSMFPEGYIFETDTLHAKWTADVNDWDLEELFSELIDRNVITPVANWRKGTPQLDEEASQYKLNHFMLQFLASKSKGFVCTSGSLTSVPRSNRNEMLRRISLHRPDPDLEVFLKTMDFFHTRSLTISSTVEGVLVNKFICLTVLDLEGWQHLTDENLSLICNSGMLLLRYFSVKNTRVSRLPPEIKKLRMLDKLVASHTQISEVPLELCELPIRSLDLRNTQIRQLPTHIWKLTALNTLLVGGDGVNCDPTIREVPRELPWLNLDLTTLVSVDLSECSAELLRSLGRLMYLTVLCIRWSFHECSDAGVQQALFSAMERWRYLKSLTIHCGLGCRMDFLAVSLPNPIFSKYLEKFKVIGGRFVSLPPWFHGLQKLASIEITVCRLEQGDLCILASLPSLKCLVLGLHFVPEEEIVIGGREGFPMLGRLSVCCRVPWLTFSEGAMPSLTYLELKIGGGPRIEDRIPSGLGNLGSLWELVLHYNQLYSNDSNVKTIVDAVRKGVAQHHNPINLVINGIQDEDEYVQEEAEGGVAVISCIQDQNDNLQKAGEDAARATGSQSEIEIVDAPQAL